MKLDLELSLQISDKLYLKSKSYGEAARQALLTEKVLSNGLYVEGWEVDLNSPSKVPQERAWIELGDRIIHPYPFVNDNTFYFPGLRFTKDQLKRFRRLPVARRYGLFGLLNTKYAEARLEAYKFAVANGLEDRYKRSTKKRNFFQRLLRLAFMALIAVPLYIIFTFWEGLSDWLSGVLPRLKKK